MAKESSGTLLTSAAKLFALIKLDKKDISSIYVFAILGGFISLSLPLGIQTIISFVQTNQISASVVVLITIVVLGVFLNGLVQVRQMQVVEKIEQKIFTRYSLAFADKLPKLKIIYCGNSSVKSITNLPNLLNLYSNMSKLSEVNNLPNIERLDCEETQLVDINNLTSLSLTNMSSDVSLHNTV